MWPRVDGKSGRMLTADDSHPCAVLGREVVCCGAGTPHGSVLTNG